VWLVDVVIADTRMPAANRAVGLTRFHSRGAKMIYSGGAFLSFAAVNIERSALV
jgi:hypothetical protein